LREALQEEAVVLLQAPRRCHPQRRLLEARGQQRDLPETLRVWEAIVSCHLVWKLSPSWTVMAVVIAIAMPSTMALA